MCVIKNDSVGNQLGIFIPDILLADCDNGHFDGSCIEPHYEIFAP
jgi:hypothetical protein